MEVKRNLNWGKILELVLEGYWLIGLAGKGYLIPPREAFINLGLRFQKAVKDFQLKKGGRSLVYFSLGGTRKGERLN